MNESQSVSQSFSNENWAISVASVSTRGWAGLGYKITIITGFILLAMSLSTKSEKSRVIKAYQTEITTNIAKLRNYIQVTVIEKL